MKTVAELRKALIEYHRNHYPYYSKKWKWYSYEKNKIFSYVGLSPYLTYVFLRIGIHPNVVTAIYAFMGILGGIFLAIPIPWFILSGIILYFLRPFLDWSDGQLSRETKRASVTGDILDSWGAFAGWVPLWAGLGLYVAEQFSDIGLLVFGISAATLFFSLATVIPVLIAINLLTYVKIRIYDRHIIKYFQDYIKKRERLNYKTTETIHSFENKYSNILRIFRSINKQFDHNHRNVDLLCLIILLELFLPFFITWAIFLVFLIWQIVFFIASFYMIACCGWVERDLREKLKQIKKNSVKLT